MSGSILTAGGAWVENTWSVVRDADPAAAAGAGRDGLLISLPALLAQDRDDVVAVWLAPTDDPLALVPWLDEIDLIAVEFPVFTDGRGYSTASLLRRRLGFRGDLRAIGDVLIDQLSAMKRVGFTSFDVRPDQDRERAVRALSTFSDAYQASVEPALPAFRRHARPDATALAGAPA